MDTKETERILSIRKQRDSVSRLYNDANGEQLSKSEQLGQEVLTRLQWLQNKPERVDLKDTAAVQRATEEYLLACANAQTVPSFSGLATFGLGRSRQALNQWLLMNPSHETTAYVENVRDAIADLMSANALTGKLNPVMSIFILKNSHGFSDQVDVHPVVEERPTLSEDEIRRRYMPESYR